MPRYLDRTLPALMLLGLALTAPDVRAAGQEDVFAGSVRIKVGLCVGTDCVSGESYGDARVKLKDQTVRLDFIDTSAHSGLFPGTDWQLYINDTGQSEFNRFSIRDLDAGTLPFTVLGGAPDNALVVAQSGNIGLGTLFPAAELHLFDTSRTEIMLEDPDGRFSVMSWGGSFSVQNLNNGQFPLSISGNALDRTLHLGQRGVGIGTTDPRARLHVQADGTENHMLFVNKSPNPNGQSAAAMAHIKSDYGDAQLYVQNTYSTTTPRTMLHLENDGRPEIVMTNIATGGEWSFGAGTNFVLKQGAQFTTPAGKTKLFEITPSGDATLTGSLTTGGTTCGGGCDRVFTETAILPQPAYARQMWAQGFLPHVGPTPEGAPLNVSQKLGGMLNALEHAHVFIDRQGARIDGQAALIEAQTTLIEAQNRRIADLEQRVTRLVDLQDNHKGPSQ